MLSTENKNEINSESTSISPSLKLNSTWIFWYASRKEKDHHIPYNERLSNIAEFNSLEEFFKYYTYLKSVQDIERNTDLGLFKKGYQPLWESCPDGGCWFLRFKKTDDPMDIDIKWEKLLLALVGEQFDEANMLGAVLSIRGRETIIELWFNYFKYEKIKNGAKEQPPRIDAQEQISKNITRSEKGEMETLPNIGATGFFHRDMMRRKTTRMIRKIV